MLIAVLEQWSWPRTKAVATALAEELTYFRNQRQRMDDPTYQANGWYIGSGAVESACKTVVESAEGVGDAVERGGVACGVPCPGVVPERGEPMAGILAA